MCVGYVLCVCSTSRSCYVHGSSADLCAGRAPATPPPPPLPPPHSPARHTVDMAHMTTPPRAQVGRGATRNEWWACPPRSGSTPRKSETVTGCWLCGLRPSEVVHETIPDPAEQAPLVARSVTPPSPSGRGGTTLPRQRAPRSCTVFVMTPPDEHTSEGGRDDRRGPVPCGIDPIKCSSAQVS